MMVVTVRGQGRTMAISERSEARIPSSVSPWVGKRMTFGEFLSLPEEKPPLEYDDGIVSQRPLLHPRESLVRGEVTSALDRVGRERRLGMGILNVTFTLPGLSLVPAVSYYGRKKIRVREDGRFEDDFGPPDVAVEITSAGYSTMSLIRKSLRYLEVGVPVALLIDPEEELVLAFRPGQTPRAFEGDDRIDLDDVLPGFDLTVRALFQAASLDWLDEPAAH